MINVKLLYEMYIEVINLKINDLLEESISYHTIHSNLLDKLEHYKPYIDLCTNYRFKEVLKFTTKNNLDKLVTSTDEIYINGEKYTKKGLYLYIDKYININKIICSNDKKINRLKDKIITYSQYRFILFKFNRVISDNIIKEGYIFNPGHAFGKLYIDKVFTKKPRVNLPESMKKKRELEEKGLVPYVKEDADRHAELGKPYNGIKYFIYYPEVDFKIRWRRHIILRRYFPFVSEFKYVPPKSYNNSFHQRMREYINSNRERALVLYNRVEQYEELEVS